MPLGIRGRHTGEVTFRRLLPNSRSRTPAPELPLPNSRSRTPAPELPLPLPIKKNFEKSHHVRFALVRLQNLSAYVIWFLEQHSMELGKEPEVLTAAKLLAKLAYENKSALQAGLIVAGWDEHRGGQVRGWHCLPTPAHRPRV
jgi:hypothetical protein